MSSDPRTDTPSSAATPRARGSIYTLILKLAFLLVIVAAAYSLGYWHNRPPEVQVAAPREATEFVGFEPAEIDLGDQLWGEVIPVEFTFVNLGSEAVDGTEQCSKSTKPAKYPSGECGGEPM